MASAVVRIDPGGEDVVVVERSSPARSEILARHQRPFDQTLVIAGVGPPGHPLFEHYSDHLTSKPALEAISAHLWKLLAQDRPDGDPRSVAEVLRDPLVHGCDRVILDLSAAPWLEELPWELLRRDDGEPLFADPACPWSRGHDLGGSRWSPADTDTSIDIDTDTSNGNRPAARWPLRVLVLIGSEPGDPDVRAEAELEAIEERLACIRDDHTLRGNIALKLIYLAVQDAEPGRVVIAELTEFRPDIVHFIGHGLLTPDGRPVLAIGDLDDPDRRKATWDPDILRGLLRRRAPRLLLLNACQSAQPRAGGKPDLTRVCLDAGVAAVVGMQAPIDGAAAVTFGRALYDALIRGEPLDTAVADARFQTLLMSAAQHDRDWSAPRLTLAVPPDQVVRVASAPVGDERPVRQCPVLRRTRYFLDRHDVGWNTWRSLDPDAPASRMTGRAISAGRAARDRQRHLVLIHGASGVGKTDLVKVVLERCALRGDRVVYVDLAGKDATVTENVLRAIRDVAPDPGADASRALLDAPWPDGTFDEFTGHLLALAHPDYRGEPVVGQVIGQDELPRKTPADDHRARLGQHGRARLPELVETFRHCLHAFVQRAGHQRLVIAVDHLPASWNGNTFRDELLDLLFNAYDTTRGDHPPDVDVRFLVVLTSEQHRDYARGDLDQLEVPAFDPVEWKRCATILKNRLRQRIGDENGRRAFDAKADHGIEFFASEDEVKAREFAKIFQWCEKQGGDPWSD